MLKQIADGLSSFFSFVATLVDFVIGMVEDIIEFMIMLPKYLATLGDMLPRFFPGEVAGALVGSFITVFSIIVLLRVLGRRSG